MKKDKDLEDREMRIFLVEQIIILSLSNAVCYIVLQRYFTIIIPKETLLIIWIFLGVLCLILGLTSKFIMVAYNFYRILFMNISMFIIYLGSSGMLDPQSQLAKIVIICCFILIELIVLIKRVFKSHKTYIHKLQKDKHEKYLYTDWLTAILIVGTGAVLAMIAEYKFIGNLSKDPSNILAALIGMVISALVTVICIHNYAKYRYVIKSKLKK